MARPPRHEDDPELEDIRGLRMAAGRGSGRGRAGAGWVAAFAVLLAVALVLWAYLR